MSTKCIRIPLGFSEDDYIKVWDTDGSWLVWRPNAESWADNVTLETPWFEELVTKAMRQGEVPSRDAVVHRAAVELARNQAQRESIAVA